MQDCEYRREREGPLDLGRKPCRGVPESAPSSQALPRHLEQEADSRAFTGTKVTSAAALATSPPLPKKLGLNRTILG